MNVNPAQTSPHQMVGLQQRQHLVVTGYRRMRKRGDPLSTLSRCARLPHASSPVTKSCVQTCVCSSNSNERLAPYNLLQSLLQHPLRNATALQGLR